MILPVIVIAIVCGLRFRHRKDLLDAAAQSEHDMVLDADGMFDYTVADFEDAILGEKKQLKKLEVFSVEIKDVATLTESGLIKWEIFKKCQVITYHGKAIYTVDLSKLSKSQIKLDRENKKVTLTIPHAELDKIDIPSDGIEFGKVNKGLLAFGDIKLTAGQSAAAETEAQKYMTERLVADQTIDEADRFAVMSVWEIFQPVVSAVSPEYQLEVVFKEGGQGNH